MADAPRVAQLRDELLPYGVVVVGVTSASRPDTETFVSEVGAYPVLANAASDRDAWGVDVVWGSVFYLVDPEGKIVVEGLDASEDRLREELSLPATLPALPQ